jgi:hypothetical protein
MIIVHPRLKKSKYSSIDTMSKPNRYCTNADPTDPVCPPMWNCPLPITMTMITPREKPMKMKTDFEERTLRQPINPFPDGDPDLAPKNINAPGTTTPGKSKDDSSKAVCRICGPRIEGVIGVPNPDPTEPWPARNADGSEQNPFEDDLFGAESTPVGIRTAGTYFPSYDVYEPGTVVSCELVSDFAADATTLVLSVPDGGVIPANGTMYFIHETLAYTFDNAGNDIIGPVNVTLNVTRRGEPPDREALDNGTECLIFNSQPTGNTSADIQVSIEANRAAEGINLKNNLSRGRGYTDRSIFVVNNENLGGSVARGGALIFSVRSTHWPDEDVSTCIVPEEGKENVAREYCCFEDSLTGKDWSGGEGRCASLGQYQVARPEEWPQHCPDGFEYAPGADGLFCKKCGTGTSTFDPTLNPANCPADGVGCQKCCEDPGVSCP